MKKRWILTLILLCFGGITGIMIASCAYNGSVTINTEDSFRFLSPDFELYPQLHNATTIDNDDDDDPDKEQLK